MPAPTDQPPPSASQSLPLARFPRALLAVLAVCLLVRLPGIDRPLVGNFATRNVVNAMLARNWALGRAPWYRPAVDVLAGGERGWHLVELPLPAYGVGGLWRMAGGSLDRWARCCTALASTAAAGLLYLLVGRRWGPKAALAAGLAWSLAPVSIIYGQGFFLEPWVACLVLAALVTAERAESTRQSGWLIVSACCAAAAALTKIYALVWWPAWLACVWPRVDASDVSDATDDGPRARPRRARRSTLSALVLAALAAAPAVAWYAWAYHLADPQGTDAERIFFSIRRSLASQDAWAAGLLDGRFWIGVARDLATVTLTPVGLGLALLGLVALRRESDRGWWLMWLVSSLALVVLLPRKFAEMNYYYVLVLPAGAMLVGLGWSWIDERLTLARWGRIGLLMIAAAFSARYTLKPAFVTPDEDRGVVAAAEAIRRLTAPDEPVVTMHGSAPDLLYYVDRPGWALSPDAPDLAARLSAAARQGARYVVVTPGSGANLPDQQHVSSGLLRPVPTSGPFAIYRLPSERVAEAR